MFAASRSRPRQQRPEQPKVSEALHYFVVHNTHLAGSSREIGHWPPAYVKPYVKRQKNDMADAQAICEAVTMTNMLFVPTNTTEQQKRAGSSSTRQLSGQQTSVINSIRAHLAEFGVIAPVGRKGIEELLCVIAPIRATNGCPMLCVHAFRWAANCSASKSRSWRPIFAPDQPDQGAVWSAVLNGQRPNVSQTTLLSFYNCKLLPCRYLSPFVRCYRRCARQ